jgi:UDP-glucose 4-epimerase
MEASLQILVTGGAGYIGSVTAHFLVESGHDVLILDDLSRGHRSAVPAKARLTVGDHGDPLVLDELLPGTDCVMHFSAHSLVPESMEKPGKYFTNNVSKGVQLLESMVKHGVGRFVFSSTAATYGQPEMSPISESAPNAPTNPYGRSKLMFEQVLEWYHAVHGIRSARLRYFNAAGAIPEAGEDHAPETHVIPIALEVARGTRDKMMIYGGDYPTPDGSCVRDYVHVADLAQAHIRALERVDEIGTDVFNLGNGSGFSVKELVAVAEEVTGRSIPTEVALRRPGDPATLVASAAKAREVLGWRPEVPGLHDIIRSAWEWFEAHPDGYPD